SLPDRFDLVAISSLSAQIQQAYELADRYRTLGVPVVLGGLHVTALPEEAGRHADAVVIGEGELAWLDVLRDAEARQLRPSYRSGPLPPPHSPQAGFGAAGPRKTHRAGRQARPRPPLPRGVRPHPHPPDPPLQAEAHREGARRDRSDPFLLAAPLHRVRRR